MYLLKTSFVLALVVFLMPNPPKQGQPFDDLAQQDVTPKVNLVAAASDTVADMSSFCDRQPGVCTTASYLIWKFEAKAKYGVRLIYEWANEAPAMTDVPQGYANQAVVVDPLTTGSTRKLAAGESAATSKNTLKLEDLIPAWRGPRAPQAS